MDGSLSIFESENYTFTRFIPGFLEPGPLMYCKSIDSFITVSSNRNLEAYSYQVLAVANSAKEREDHQNVSGKRVNAEWRLNIGECTIDISVVPLANRTAIMVLGERTLYCVHDSGQLGYMKKLEYNPACFFPYPSEGGQTVSCIVCTHSRQLLVYEGVTLKWATLLDETPVQVTVGTFRQIPGMIVTLTDRCHVTCSYLGSHPSIFNLPHSTQRMTDQATVNDEMSKINCKIRELHSRKGDALSKTKDSDDLSVHIRVPPTIDRVSVASQHSVSTTNGPVPSVTVQVILKTARRVADVQITIHVDEPLACTQKHIKIPAIGIPKAVTASGKLPLSLVAYAVDPIKTLDHAITLETSVPCLNLLELFPEFSAADAGPNCVGVRLIHGSQCTILSSKSSYRYRVQSETYTGLWLITDELVGRLQSSNLGSNYRISYQQAPNLDHIYSAIDRHSQVINFMKALIQYSNELRHRPRLQTIRLVLHCYKYFPQAHDRCQLVHHGDVELFSALWVSKGHIQEMLGQRAQQFRAIQRRMLTKFKDKATAPLNCLDTLLAGTYRQILALADACEENYQTIIMSNCELSSSLRLLILLTKLWLSLTEEEADHLLSHLCVDVKEADVSWEQTADRSVSILIRTMFSQPDKAIGRLHTPVNAADTVMSDSASKVKKHIKALFDHLAKRKHPMSQLNPVAGSVSNISGQGQDTSVKALHPLHLERDITVRGDIREDNQSSLMSDVANNASLASSPVTTAALNLQKGGNESYAGSNHELEQELLFGENSIASAEPDDPTKSDGFDNLSADIDSPSFFMNSEDDAILM